MPLGSFFFQKLVDCLEQSTFVYVAALFFSLRGASIRAAFHSESRWGENGRSAMRREMARKTKSVCTCMCEYYVSD